VERPPTYMPVLQRYFDVVTGSGSGVLSYEPTTIPQDYGCENLTLLTPENSLEKRVFRPEGRKRLNRRVGEISAPMQKQRKLSLTKRVETIPQRMQSVMPNTPDPLTVDPALDGAANREVTRSAVCKQVMRAAQHLRNIQHEQLKLHKKHFEEQLAMQRKQFHEQFLVHRKHTEATHGLLVLLQDRAVV
jgi:predicted DNA-binding protein YlxM (UPF0122 family)